MPTIERLNELQALPLERKIFKTQARIIEWYLKFKGQVYVSFSGGKDSTVLLHIARRCFPDIEGIFCDTGLEYPEIRQFAKSFDNITQIRPKMRFDEVIKKHGYPFISKEVAERVYNARKCLAGGGGDTYSTITSSQASYPGRVQQMLGIGGFFSKRFDFSKWKPLLDMDFNISHLCCNEMKKKPLNHLEKKAIVATMTEESMLRRTAWLQAGCNAFKKGISKPMSFWTEQDVLTYIRRYDLPIASVYGEVVTRAADGNLYGSPLCDCGGKLCTTGCHRTGCIFCGFGAHRDTRFRDLKRTHPRQYEYCMDGGAYDSDGMWKPAGGGLGMAHCIDQINKKFGKDFIMY